MAALEMKKPRNKKSNNKSRLILIQTSTSKKYINFEEVFYTKSLNIYDIINAVIHTTYFMPLVFILYDNMFRQLVGHIQVISFE